MPDVVLPSLKEAFEHTDDCYVEVNRIIDSLEEALERLPESDTEIRASIHQTVDKAFELMDACSALSNELNELRLKYRASYMPSQVPPGIDELREVLTRIETRRRATGSSPE